MEIVGQHMTIPEIKHKLQVPLSYESLQTPTITDATREQLELKRNSIEKSIVETFSHDKNVNLDYKSLVTGYLKDYVDVELESSPLSRNQGPLIPGLDDRIRYGYGIR